MLRSLCCAVLVFSSAILPAQGDPDPQVRPPLEVELVAVSGVVKIGQPLELELRIVANAATQVPAAALGGIDLEATIDGRKAAPIRQTVPGAVLLAAGTTIHRRISLDSGQYWSDADLRGATQVHLRWAALDGVETTVRVVPDLSGIDVSKLDLSKTRVRFVTSAGDLVIGFFPDQAPGHVVNMIELCKSGFYDGTRFHRILRGFMVQGGCPNTKLGADGTPGTGGPGYAIPAEFSDIKHVRGIVSMARGSGEDTAGSQFFLMHGAAPHLDGKYSAFGQIEEGLEVLDRIADTPVRPAPTGEPSVPVQDVWLWAAIVEPVFKD